MSRVGLLADYPKHVEHAFPPPSSVPDAYSNLMHKYHRFEISEITLLERLRDLLRGHPDLLTSTKCLPSGCSYKFDSNGKAVCMVIDVGSGSKIVSFSHVTVTSLAINKLARESEVLGRTGFQPQWLPLTTVS
ncbi:hypothetical protein CLAFUW4_13287 [Fulvia fulva]|uniref:Uncharacterized protein n=1 Tax=Passalora fulva TaxID=5499 RepID=A0A9Q8PKD6_PASFU|nr:uncharacterized protein CLAFUR5_13142 [Fulvia fulva]KAK4612259.1 hypothetical protein CLAFUR4_13292 [Fulvia fulva]KAK4613070.1 hypothetical protein CLAFUR0_13297 [Fulvia fulva]UJO24035.1 hypothetical protein CLAFUR5_13142 [Fulvia fulva]WPV21398.1 hypothetical protein CLAFUW4_13287 [Fulvia fulva]WPV36559.1 hypothetical protein CLAFUW7_13294 [Fulvia fulva]